MERKNRSKARLTHLRVKIRSLAEEARIIRHEEHRALAYGRKLKAADKDTYEHLYRRYESLHDHRTKDVREHTRSSLLAYGFLRGVPYRRMEAKCFEDPSWSDVKKHAKNFAGTWTPEDEAAWQRWLAEAKGAQKAA